MALWDKRPFVLSQDTEPQSIDRRHEFKREHIPYHTRHFNNYSQCPVLE